MLLDDYIFKELISCIKNTNTEATKADNLKKFGEILSKITYDQLGLKAVLLGMILDLEALDFLYIFINTYRADFLHKAYEIKNISVFLTG